MAFGVVSYSLNSSAPVDCPTVQSQGFTDAGRSYKFSCNWDIPFGPGKYGPAVKDIMVLSTLSIYDCARACSMVNTQLVQNRTSCHAMVFMTRAKDEAESFKAANCWLKNDTSPDDAPLIASQDYITGIVSS